MRVLVADDHHLFRQGLVALLRGVPEIEVVAEADTGRVALGLIESHGPDVAVLDLEMPDLTGLDVLRELARNGCEVPVVLVTMHKEPEMLAQALALGVKGYVLKENAFDDLVHAIRRAAAGGRFLSPDLIDLPRGRDDDAPLTSREREVLGLVVDGLTSREIASRLLISLKTVEAHRANLMRKLDVSNVAQLVRLALDRGLVRRT
jgi:DNA-binding NarL/FixJ family response regulator